MVIPFPCAFTNSLISTKTIQITQNVHFVAAIVYYVVHKNGPL